MADEVMDTGAAPVETGAVATESTPVETPNPVEGTTPDANDPFNALQAAMDAEFGAEVEDASAETPAEGAVPAEFQQLMQISPFVQSREHVESAVRAADEVWKVAAGELPASNLLEGMRAANPQGFESVIGNLIPYIEQITGQKFGGQPETPPDPRDKRLAAIEAQFAQEQEARQAAVWNQQVAAAREKANAFITEKSKGTFAEGNEAYLLQQCANKVGVPEQQMVDMLLQGKTEKLEAAYRSVVKDEIARLKAYNSNLIKKKNTLASAVPAVKGGNISQGNASVSGRKEGETDIQYATRLWNEGNK